VSDLTAALEGARRSVAARDAEILRLGARVGAGPDVDRLALEQRADVSNEIVLALNMQVGGFRLLGGVVGCGFGCSTCRWVGFGC